MTIPAGAIPSGYYEKLADDFNRANENPLADPWDYVVSAGIVDNRLDNNAVGGATNNAGSVGYHQTAIGDNQYAAVLPVYEAAGYNIGPATRVGNGTENFYAVRLLQNLNLYDCYKVVNGTWSQVGTNAEAAFNVGDWVGMIANGTTLTRYRYNGAYNYIIDNTDSSLSSGRAGFYGQGPTAGAGGVNEWSAGDDQAPAGGGVPIFLKQYRHRWGA